MKIGIIGLGYVGLPLACLFAKKYPTVGYDPYKVRVESLNGLFVSVLRQLRNRNVLRGLGEGCGHVLPCRGIEAVELDLILVIHSGFRLTGA